jgi:hypothetical protein
MFRPQFLGIFGKLKNFSQYVAYVSNYVAEILHILFKIQSKFKSVSNDILNSSYLKLDSTTYFI